MTPAVNLLLIEDDEIDVQGFRRAFAKSRIANPMVVAKDGIEALDILRGQNGKLKLQKPLLILLDLNLPRMNGFEFLEAIRADPELKTTLVFVVTTSKAEEDKAKAYGQHIAGYIVKQDPANTFLQAVALLEHYWRIVEFPD